MKTISPSRKRGRSSGGRGRSSRDRRKSASKRSGRRTKCRFCRSRTSTVDYKDINSLRKLTTLHGKIYSRKRSGNCARHQRQLKIAIKRARYLALV